MKEYGQEENTNDISFIREKLLLNIRRQIANYNVIMDNIELTQIQNSVSIHLNRNPHIVDSIYKKITQGTLKPQQEFIYQVSVDESSEMMILQIMDILEEKHKNSISVIKDVIRKEEEVSTKTLKNSYIELLVNIGGFLTRYGFIDTYIQSNNRKMKEIDFQELKIGIEQRKQIEGLFNKEQLQELEIKELVLLCTFYQNRMVKEKQNLYRAIFCIEELGLWGSSIYKRQQIEDDTLRAIFLKKIIVDKINRVYNGKKDIPKQIQKVNENKKEYKEVFDEILPELPNDLAKDAIQEIVYSHDDRRCYQTKQELTYKLIEELRNDTKINWGYIPQSKWEEENEVIVGVDFPGYNMPMTVHIPNERLATILSGMGQKTIPEYIGNDDIFIEGRKVSTNILYPLTKQQKEKIATKARKCPKTEEFDFVHHINAIAKGIKPYHLAKPKGKARTVNPQDWLK